MPLRFFWHPHPTRASGAPPPPPSGGRGPCVAISGEQPCPGWSRREIVSGVELVGNRIRGGAGGPPCLALLQVLPMCWTVGISPRGERLTGRGNLFPLPCLPHSNHLTSRRPPPPRLRLQPAGYPYALCRRLPPRPRLRQGDTHTLLLAPPHPARAFMRDTRIPRRKPPPRPRLRRRIPIPFCQRPPPGLSAGRPSIPFSPAPPPRLSRGKGSARSDSRHGPCIAFSPLDRFAPPRHRRVWPPEGAMPDGGCAQASAAHSISKRFAKKEVI